MIITFNNGTAHTLVDYTANPKISGIIDQAPKGIAEVQSALVYNGPDKVNFPRGNVSGQFAFTSDCSYASYAAALAALKAGWAILTAGLPGALVFTPIAGGGNATMSGACLREFTPVLWNGLQMKFHYSFEITTLV